MKATPEQLELLAKATPWQIAELIVHFAQNLEPFYNPDPLDKTERLSANPHFSNLTDYPTQIKTGAIRSLCQILDRIAD